MKFNEISEFTKDFKKLERKYRTLREDLKALKEVLGIKPTGHGKKHFSLLHTWNDIYILKTRLYCQCLGTNTLRVVYAFHKKENTLVLIQLYFKGDSEREDKERIKEYKKQQR